MDYFLRMVEQNPESIRNINRLRIMHEPDKIDPTGYLDYLKLASIALSKNGLLFEYVKGELTNNDYVRLAGIAIMNNPETIQFVEKYRTDLKFDENGVEIDPFTSFDLGEDNSKEIPYFDELEYYVKVAKNPRYIKDLPTELHHYKDIIMAAMQQAGFSLEYVPSEKIDKEIALAAIQKDAYSILFIPKKVIDKEIVLSLLQVPNTFFLYKYFGFPIEHVPKEIFDKEIALAAVKANGMFLNFIPYEIIDKEIALTAVNQNIYAFEYVLPNIEGYKEIERFIISTIINRYISQKKQYDADSIITELVGEFKFTRSKAEEVVKDYYEYLDNNQEKTM